MLRTLLLAGVVSTLAGCSWIDRWIEGPWAYASPGTGASPGAVVPPPSFITPNPGSCTSASHGPSLVDETWAFRLTLPAGWQNLRPGDDGWVQMYGQHGLETERRVEAGEIQDFAIPLHDATTRHEQNLAVYVDRVPDRGLVAEAEAFVSTSRRAVGGQEIAIDYLKLPAGDSARVITTYPDPDEPSFSWRGTSYFFYHLGYRYAFEFVSPGWLHGAYDPTFDCVAASVGFLPHPPTGSTTPQPHLTSS